MPYEFLFDLTRAPPQLFREVAKAAALKGLCRGVREAARSIVERLGLAELMGLSLRSVVRLVEDLISVEALNREWRRPFAKSTRRALFLPHCSRKFMDSRCRAEFDPEASAYACSRCSQDCLINAAAAVAEGEGVDVYVVPGGSCIPKIIKKMGYDGVVGVACSSELRASAEALRELRVPGQAVPLLRNGCSRTYFSLEGLFRVLKGG